MTHDDEPATDAQMLACDFFAGDKDGDGREAYTVRVVTTRAEHECLFAPEWRHPIPPGSRARVDKALVDGKWRTFYSCADCHARAIREEQQP